MKKRLILIALIIVGLVFVPAVSAYEQTYTYKMYGDSSTTSLQQTAVVGGFVPLNNFYVEHIENFPIMRAIQAHQTIGDYMSIPTDPQTFDVTYTIDGKKVGSGKYGSFRVGSTGYVWLSFDTWDITGYSGAKTIVINYNSADGTIASVKRGASSGDRYYYSWTDNNHRVFWGTTTSNVYPSWHTTVFYTIDVKNTFMITDHDGYKIGKIIRNIDGKISPSYLYLKDGDTVIDSGTVSSSNDVEYLLMGSPITYGIKFVGASQWFNATYTGDSGEGPTEPGEPLIRTGTVTMTDNNGTTISGFKVTAVNHYTGEEYTTSTESDVATITLPMDRTIKIRNPQTGVYEEAPIGYYRFYGNKSGYKMLNEDGIQVSVMPEKYGSYKLCDILVTSDTGYLTGKHLFQIRSRSDNSILQTGTISAQSATTGEWYNTTVIHGIATLILPYDTSNPISQYAGNYYVYATSPGYQDSDYGTQIVVMPHTVSEINTILLTPIGGIPTAGNVTLRIQAFSETGPGVPNAKIFIAGVDGAGSDVWNTYTASSTGYLTVSVPGNSTYDIVASGEGYYDSARRITVYTDDPPLIEIKLYLSGAPTVEPTIPPTGWVTTQPTTQPTGGIPDEDDGSDSFLMQAVRGIGLAFGVGFSTAKLIFGMLMALSIGFATAKQLRGGATEFGLGLLGGTMLGVLVGLLPVWIIVVLLLVVGLYIGHQYVGGGNNG